MKVGKYFFSCMGSIITAGCMRNLFDNLNTNAAVIFATALCLLSIVGMGFYDYFEYKKSLAVKQMTNEDRKQMQLKIEAIINYNTDRLMTANNEKFNQLATNQYAILEKNLMAYDLHFNELIKENRLYNEAIKTALQEWKPYIELLNNISTSTDVNALIGKENEKIAALNALKDQLQSALNNVNGRIESINGKLSMCDRKIDEKTLDICRLLERTFLSVDDFTKTTDIVTEIKDEVSCINLDTIKDEIINASRTISDDITNTGAKFQGYIEQTKEKQDEILKKYDILLGKTNDLMLKLSEDEFKIIEGLKTAYRCLETSRRAGKK